MSTERLAYYLANMTAALGRLGEALAVPETAPLAVDGTIQRFEFALEMSWKALKHALAEEGISSSTPREAVGKALAAGWIADEDAWQSMLRDRNETSYIYSSEAALAIYRRIGGYHAEMQRLQCVLLSRPA